MALSPKAKAFTFAASLLLVSTVMVGTSIATTGSVLRPFAAGEAYAEERPLTRGHHAAMSVVVSQAVGEQLQPLAGANVTVARPGQEPVASKQTDAQGTAIFELRPGAYEVLVTSGELNTTRKVVLQHSARVAIVFGEEGSASWTSKDHRSMERRGDSASLAVRVMRNETNRSVPVEGASIKVYALKDDGSRELVQEGATDARGYISFQLHKGAYVLNVTAGSVTAEREGVLRNQAIVGVLIDGDEVQWRGGQMQDGKPGQDHGPRGPPSSRAPHPRPTPGGG